MGKNSGILSQGNRVGHCRVSTEQFFVSTAAMKAAEFFAWPRSLEQFASYFDLNVEVWTWLPQIKAALAGLKGNTAEREIPVGVTIEGEVWLAPSVKLPGTATLIGPAWIGPGTEIRPGAYVRGNVIVGAHGVLGNSCEFKNCLLLDGVQVPHFSYVGDSLLGNKAHLAAGLVLSNLRLRQQPITLRLPTPVLVTGVRKLGAILGDGAEVGCNAVLQPGTLIWQRVLVMPTMAFGGYLPPAHLAKNRSAIVTLPRRD